MRKLLLCLLAPALLGAQEGEVGLYHQTFLHSGKNTGHVDYLQWWVADSAAPHGWWGFVSTDKGYFSTTIGKYLDIGEHFEVGISGGFESIRIHQNEPYSNFGRFAATVRVGTIDTDDAFLDGYYEFGASGEPWYQANAALSRGHLLIGLMSQTGAGTGPRLRLTLPIRGVDVRPWAAPSMIVRVDGNWTMQSVVGLDIVLHHSAP